MATVNKTTVNEVARVDARLGAKLNPAPSSALIKNDPRPELDYVALALGPDGKPLQTSTRTGKRTVQDPESIYRQVVREWLTKGEVASNLTPKTAAEFLRKAGTDNTTIAKIDAEEASSFFRMAKDQFFRTGDQWQQIKSQAGDRPSKGQRVRLDQLKSQAQNHYINATRASSLLGNLDPERNRDLSDMEQQLLAMGFPRDEMLFQKA